MSQIRSGKFSSPNKYDEKPASLASGRIVHGLGTQFNENSRRKSRLLMWDEMPHWYQDNEYLLSGYRTITGSHLGSFQTLFQIHNETVNIYSHLLASLGSILIATPIYKSLQPRYGTASRGDVFVFGTYFLGIAICFLLSAIFHLFSNHSERMRILGGQLDYLGIIFLVWGCATPYIYYGFYCHSHLQITYWALNSINSILCVFAVLDDRFRKPAYRNYRTLMFSFLGSGSFAFPAAHALWVDGWEVQKERMSLGWVAWNMVFLGIGAAVYSTRIPERWYPRTFDIWGASHQIMHCMTISAGASLLIGLLKAFDHLHSQGDICRKLL